MLSKDLSVLSTIPEETLEKLSKKIEYCLSDSVCEQVAEGKEIVELDISIGKLLLKLIDEDIKFKFIPTPEFKKMIKESYNGENKLSKALEKNIVLKVTKVYKDLL